MRGLTRLCLFLLAFHADPAWGLRVRNLSLLVGTYVGTNYDSYLLLDSDTERLQNAWSLGWDIDLLHGRNSALYWDNAINAKSSDKQFRHVGWDTEFGLRIQRIELLYHHYSQHSLEQKRVEQHFPLENYIGVRVRFIK